MEFSHEILKIKLFLKKAVNNSRHSSEEEVSRRTTEISNDSNFDSGESFSRYVFDRTAPSFFMILAEQELSRQESMNDEDPYLKSNTMQNALGAQLGERLDDLKDQESEESVEHSDEKLPSQSNILHHLPDSIENPVQDSVVSAVAEDVEEKEPQEEFIKRETVRFKIEDDILGASADDEEMKAEPKISLDTETEITNIEETSSKDENSNVITNQVVNS